MARCPYCNENHPDELMLCPTTGSVIPDTKPAVDPLVGAVLEGKYQIERKLGEGGMGAVYVGEHRMMKRRVAIKTLLPRYTTNQNAVQRFQREAQAASAIGHPNIVTIHDLGQTPDGMLYIVMELLDGQDLAHALRALREDPSGSRIMDPARVLAIARQVADGLAAAHEKGVVHRDLKPDNIFLVPTREGGERAKLLDFGISKIRTPGGEESRLTTDGSLLGTPYYMSPEQAQGKSDIDHRADIYAFGVILYELFTGRVPFDDENMLRVIAMHALEAPLAPRQANPVVSPAAESVILKAMAKEPVMRFQTMVEMRDAVETLAAAADPTGTSAGHLHAPPRGAPPPTVTPASFGGEGSGVGLTPGFLTAPATGVPASVVGSGSPQYGGGSSQVGFGAPQTGASYPGTMPPSTPGSGWAGEPSYPSMATGASGVSHVTSTPMSWDDGAPQRGSGLGLKITLGVIVLLLLGGVGTAVALMMTGGGEEPVVAQPGPMPQYPQIPATQPVPQVQPMPVPVPVPTVPVVLPPVVPEVPTTAPPAEEITVRFESEPSKALVFRGEEELGETPHEVTIARGAEEQRFVLRRSGYRDHPVAVVPDRDRTIQSSLERVRRVGGSTATKTSPGGTSPPGGGTTGPGGLFKANPFGP